MVGEPGLDSDATNCKNKPVCRLADPPGRYIGGNTRHDTSGEDHMGRLTLILGGARSGKSSFAEQQAKELGGDSVLYVATSEAKDDEMQQRVTKHRAGRPSAWGTLEASRNVAQALRQEGSGARVILLDCMTFLVANHLMDVAAPKDDPFDDPSADPFDPQIEAN